MEAGTSTSAEVGEDEAAPVIPHSPPPRPDLPGEYRRRREARLAEAGRWQGRRDRLGLARVAAFAAGLGVVWAAVEGAASGWWLLAPAALVLALTPPFARAGGRAARARRAAAWYDQGLARLAGGAPGPDGLEYLEPDHPYAADLDLFGPGNLFPRLCAARTRAGRDTLAGWLLAHADPAEADDRRAAAAELAARLDLRERLALAADPLGRGVDTAGLLAWASEDGRWQMADGSEEPKTRRPLPSAICLLPSLLLLPVAVTVVALVLWVGGWTGPKPFAWAAAAQGAIALALRGRVRRALAGLGGRSRDLLLLTGLMNAVEAEPLAGPRLGRLRASLQSGGASASRRLAELARVVTTLDAARNGLFALTVGPLTLWTTRAGLAVEQWRRTAGPAVPRWLDAVGEVEALASLAGWAAERPGDAEPEFATGPPVVEAEGLTHPLLPPGRAVANDVAVGGRARLVVVSGSNMSGKSTYLRAVGLAVVLARAGAVVSARRMRLSPLAVGASLRATDSVLTGRSRFAAELAHLRRVADLAAAGPTLFLLDELLHGTNSHDRRAGAAAVLRGLLGRGAVGLVTTHDLALTELAGELGAANVHFADDWHDGGPAFDYRLRPGVVKRSNALALMRAVGLLDA